MCGICGIIDKRKNIDYSDTLGQMIESLKHRGPDARGCYIKKEDGIFFGHRRLRIIDLNPRSDQPMKDSDENLVIIFNGEIYNHLEIKKELLEKGYKFNSTSDTEVILQGYKEYGTSIFSKMDGDFALAIWDNKNKKTIIARDHLGIKPLYYLDIDGTFLFSSEAKAFKNLNIPNWQKSLNQESFHLLLGFQYNFDADNTLIRGVKKFPAGSFIEITDEGTKKSNYWNLPYRPISPSYSEACESTSSLLVDAVSKRILNCDVSQGILLSGGLDSSTVAAIAAQIAGSSKIKTFNAISDNKLDERNYASLVAEHIGSEHTQVYMDGSNILNSIDELIKVYDDLNTVDPGVVSETLLSEKISSYGIRVVLVGEGADEVFGGYSWYGLSKLPFNLLPSKLRNELYYYVLSRKLPSKEFFYYSNFLNAKVNSYYGDIFSKITSYELLDQLPNHFILKVDKGNMANGLEARVPYLDYKLVEYVTNLPANYKLEGRYFNYWKSWEKRILRDVAKPFLPTQIVQRKKHGFMLSMIDTINSNKKYVKDRIFSNKDIICETLSPKYFDWLFSESANYDVLGLDKIKNKEKEFMTWKLFLFSVWYDYMFK